MSSLIVRGARVHNLQNVDVELPRDALVVVTGLSGSGKSSLAFDTIYAEGQRRYVESLSAHARQFLEQMGKPDVDSIEGLSPAIAIEQRAPSRNPRSTVGTITEIHDYLRLLYARAGRVHCYRCGREIRAQTVQEMVDRITEWPKGTRFSVVAPVARKREGRHGRQLEQLRRSGYLRVAVDGNLLDLSEGLPDLDRRKPHDIDVYVDRLVVKDGIRQRLTDSVELALGLSHGLLRAVPLEGEELVFSERHACIECGISYPEIEPRMFSFNSPHGACPDCDGLGVRPFVDPSLVVPDESKSVRDGAIEPWRAGRRAAFYDAILEAVCDHFAIDMDRPWRELPRAHREILLRGHDDEVQLVVARGKSKTRVARAFGGVLAALERKLTASDEDGHSAGPSREGEVNDRYVTHAVCASCDGTRLRRESRHVEIAGRSLPEICALSIARALPFLRGLDRDLDARARAVAGRLVAEVGARLGFLSSVGLDYLSLDRPAATLSNGEAQRIRLATQIGSSLVGVLYVLDEPSIGLHPRDNERLLASLCSLRDAGNSVLVVEHDEETIRRADYVVDMGPRAGVHGGRVVAAGTVTEIEACPDSLTGKYLTGELEIELPEKRRVTGKHLVLKGAREHNLRNLTVRFPVGVFTCVTGVSGSGKSTLVMDTLRPALQGRLGRSSASRRAGGIRHGAGEHDALEGAHHVDRMVAIDQTPIGRTPRSNPATYTGLLKLIRDLFAGLPESRARGYKAGRYSFNVKGGRCEACMGDGLVRIEMNFLPDLYVECDACKGRRFNRETLEVRYKGSSIADVLDMTVEEALEFLANVPKARVLLETLRDVGLGYITLGQSATTLSGGEAQRLKLSRELAKKGAGRTLYILDEPTTGLHFDDIRQLLRALNLLVDKGNSAIVIEHNLEVIKTADHVIDLGPEGGEGGGQLVVAGTPEEVARAKESHTGRFLRALLA